MWGNTNYAQSYDAVWRSTLRICSPDIFPVYFRIAIPEGAISNAEMLATLALSADEQTFADKLLEFSTQKRPDGTTRLRGFWDRLEDYTRTTITEDQAVSIITALILVGDDLLVPEDETKGILEFGTDTYISRGVYQLLQRLKEEERFILLQEAIRRSDSLVTVVREVAFLERGAEESPETSGDGLISVAHMESLKAQALSKLQKAATGGSMYSVPGLLMILYRWRDWGELEDARAWVRQRTETDAGLVEFLEKTKNKIITEGGDDLVARVHYEIDLVQIKPFVYVPDLISRAEQLLTSHDGLSGEMRELLVQLIEGWNEQDEDRAIEVN